MGNRFICMTKKDAKDNGSKSKKIGRSQRKMLAEEELLHRQALSMAIHQHQLSQRFDGSMSRRVGGSTSSRRRNLSDPFSNGKQLPEFLDNIKGKRFVLIHGEGFGAWCWYKTIALLEESGLLPTALDLTGSGIDLTDTNSVTTLVDYSKPLINFLQDLPEDEKVILVGHSSGGACISYVLEHCSTKISKAVFLCATMVSDGQRPFDVFAEEVIRPLNTPASQIHLLLADEELFLEPLAVLCLPILSFLFLFGSFFLLTSSTATTLSLKGFTSGVAVISGFSSMHISIT